VKLFIWNDVLRDYTAGVIFAMAHDVDEARRIIGKADMGEYFLKEVAGPPDEVYDAPAMGYCWGGG
jgi:hypothetical protein